MSVTAAAGFRAAGVGAGSTSAVALVVNDGPRYDAAAVFGTDDVVAGSVLWSRQVVSDGLVQAVVLNSGPADGGTAPDGFADTHRTAEHTAAVLTISAADVVVCATGPAGGRLPVLLDGIDAAARALSDTGGPAVAEAIRATGSHVTQAVVAGKGFVVGAVAGAVGGTAGPGCVITTDAVADAALLHDALTAGVGSTSERVGGDVSAGCTVLLMAGGASGVTPASDDLVRAVQDVCAQLLVRPEAHAGAHPGFPT